VPQGKLREYVSTLQAFARPNESPGMDCSIVATRHAGLFSVSTTDFFYPLVECPYLQGRIGACNVLSDLYAVGCSEVDTVLMLLAVSMDMAEEDRDVCTTEMMRGFNDTVAEAGASVTGGQTVRNPWPMIGGCAYATAREEELVRPEGARVGNVLVLTKPLGTQIAVNVWQKRPPHADWEARFAPLLSLPAAAALYDAACASMATLSAPVARLMKAHGATAATDVTGFGILGHAENLAEHTREPCTLRIHTLPCFAGAAEVDTGLGGDWGWGLLQGRSAETSGGMLVALPSQQAAAAFCEALGGKAWVVGEVLPRAAGATSNTAEIAADAKVLSV
jgi:selenide,water dikinase